MSHASCIFTEPSELIALLRRFLLLMISAALIFPYGFAMRPPLECQNTHQLAIFSEVFDLTLYAGLRDVQSELSDLDLYVFHAEPGA